MKAIERVPRHDDLTSADGPEVCKHSFDLSPKDTEVAALVEM
jgi:hypothetical protein